MPRLSPLAFRRVLRKKATDAEIAVWGLLRRRRLGPKFRRQHTAGPYTLDFFCPSARLAIELDGGQHYEGPQLERDLARDAWLEDQGIHVLRFSDREALLESAVVEEAIWEALQERMSR